MGPLALFAPAAAARIERNPVEIYLSGLSATGKRSMDQKLTAAAAVLEYSDARHVSWADLRFEHVATIRTQLSEQGKSPATINAETAKRTRSVTRRGFGAVQFLL